jgi:hypothetical protein
MVHHANVLSCFIHGPRFTASAVDECGSNRLRFVTGVRQSFYVNTVSMENYLSKRFAEE